MHIEHPATVRSGELRTLTRWLGVGRSALVSLVAILLTGSLTFGQAVDTKPSPGTKEKASNASTPIPGGGLDAHERAGGHLLSRHVGKSGDQLRQRLDNDSKISAASSFTDRKTAESAIAAALAANQKKISSWLKGEEDRLVITYRSPTPVGISVGRHSSRARDANGLRLVLVRDSKFTGGWRILTGYPEA